VIWDILVIEFRAEFGKRDVLKTTSKLSKTQGFVNNSIKPLFWLFRLIFLNGNRGLDRLYKEAVRE